MIFKDLLEDIFLSRIWPAVAVSERTDNKSSVSLVKQLTSRLLHVTIASKGFDLTVVQRLHVSTEDMPFINCLVSAHAQCCRLLMAAR